MAPADMRDPSPPLPPDPTAAQHVPQGFASPRFPPAPQQQQQQQQQTSSQSSSPTRTRAKGYPMPADLRQQQPTVQDALEDAFGHAPAMNQMDPEVINQITQQVTQQVIASLQSQNPHSNGTTPTPSAPPPRHTQYPPPPPPATQPTPRSPTQSSTASSIPQRFTPPTPDRSRDVRGAERSFDSSSPEPPISEDGSSFSRGSMDSERSRETPRPRQADNRMPQPRQPAESSGRRSSASGSTTKASLRRNSRGSEKAHDGPSRSRPRPMRPPSRPADEEATTLEKIWQPLFDSGNPTMRLSQFLRGLAIHLIDDYEPRGSLVVTPAKMLRFFEETKVTHEHYPWDTIFGGKMNNASLTIMYRKLLCQHHYVQNQNHEVPSIPALTPNGFEFFMTCLIQAHPNSEFERLSKAVMNMPISNADNLAERFPKELSRRLLPAEPSVPAEQRLISSLVHEPQLFSSLRGASNMPPPPSSAPPQQQNWVTERERKPYSHASHSNAIDDDDLAPPSVQIERERKPYSAKEGAGKVYNADDHRAPPAQPRPDARPMRTNANPPSQGLYDTNGGQSFPMNIPPRKNTPHRMSASGAPPVMSGSYSRAGRRTPPPRNPYARSEPVDVSGMLPQDYSSNLHPREPRGPYPGDFDDDPLRRYPSRPSQRDRSGTNGHPPDDDPRGYPIPPRNVPVPNHGYDYGANGPPVGSFPSRRPGLSGSGDDRRRSMYGAAPTVGCGDGGTDGYGSFSGGANGGWPPQQQQQQPPPPQQQQQYGSSSVAH